MNYIMKSGCLSGEQSGEIIAKIKSTLTGPVKKIARAESEYYTDIRRLRPPREHSGDLRFREYVFGEQSSIKMIGRPGYADGEDPLVAGWPVCRMPRADRIRIILGAEEFALTMHNSQNYSLRDKTGYVVLQIIHRGLNGGWLFHDDHGFSPEILCGIFVFCRYLEQENELMIV